MTSGERFGLSSFLLPQSGETAKTWLTKTWLTEPRQVRFAAETCKSRQIWQARTQARRKILWQRRHAARPCTTRRFLCERFHLFGRRHAAAEAHRLRDAGHRAALARAHGLHHVGHVPVHL